MPKEKVIDKQKDMRRMKRMREPNQKQSVRYTHTYIYIYQKVLCSKYVNMENVKEMCPIVRQLLFEGNTKGQIINQRRPTNTTKTTTKTKSNVLLYIYLYIFFFPKFPEIFLKENKIFFIHIYMYGFFVDFWYGDNNMKP